MDGGSSVKFSPPDNSSIGRSGDQVLFTVPIIAAGKKLGTRRLYAIKFINESIWPYWSWYVYFAAIEDKKKGVSWCIYLWEEKTLVECEEGKGTRS